ncbi:WecB/TagA/CpsF family glycosyltransferase [Candidatus Woesebacteria bacterium]|nr:WecB/TagA/CpsF family glycosyltransferase [Candidatus Woesebacteria bacterium]
MKKILHTSFHPSSKKEILEKIERLLLNNEAWIHIVSLNLENVVHAYYHDEFNNVLSQKATQIVDGAGILIASSFLRYGQYERITGADFMPELIKHYADKGFRFLFIGGKPNLAERISICYSQTYPKSTFKGIQGIVRIGRPQPDELQQISNIIIDYKPHFVFVAFGSPDQELLLDRYKDLFQGTVCMGVGGGFEFASGDTPRAPKWMRKYGFEWLFRLISQPWRLRRQLKLPLFFFLLFLQKCRLLK